MADIVTAVRPKALRPHGMQLDSDAIQRWVVTVPNGTELSDVLRPEFWVHEARKVLPGASITVFPDGGEWEAELRVRDAGPRHLAVGVLSHHKWTEDAAGAGAEVQYKVEWASPSVRWRVVRLSDRAVMEQNIQTKDAAYARLADLMKAAA